MLIRNKARTWYRAPGITVAPGGTANLPDPTAWKLLQELPWHFEAVATDAPKKAPEAPVEEPKRKRKGW